jgi:hypothetical protein
MFPPISLYLLGLGIAGLWLVGSVVVLSLVYAYGERQQRLQADSESTPTENSV